MEQLGQIAYEAYCEALGVHRPFTEQNQAVRDAWSAAAEAVAQYLEKT